MDFELVESSLLKRIVVKIMKYSFFTLNVEGKNKKVKNHQISIQKICKSKRLNKKINAYELSFIELILCNQKKNKDVLLAMVKECFPSYMIRDASMFRNCYENILLLTNVQENDSAEVKTWRNRVMNNLRASNKYKKLFECYICALNLVALTVKAVIRIPYVKRETPIERIHSSIIYTIFGKDCLASCSLCHLKVHNIQRMFCKMEDPVESMNLMFKHMNPIKSENKENMYSLDIGPRILDYVKPEAKRKEGQYTFLLKASEYVTKKIYEEEQVKLSENDKKNICLKSLEHLLHYYASVPFFSGSIPRVCDVWHTEKYELSLKEMNEYGRSNKLYSISSRRYQAENPKNALACAMQFLNDGKDTPDSISESESDSESGSEYESTSEYESGTDESEYSSSDEEEQKEIVVKEPQEQNILLAPFEGQALDPSAISVQDEEPIKLNNQFNNDYLDTVFNVNEDESKLFDKTERPFMTKSHEEIDRTYRQAHDGIAEDMFFKLLEEQEDEPKNEYHLFSDDEGALNLFDGIGVNKLDLFQGVETVEFPEFPFNDGIGLVENLDDGESVLGKRKHNFDFEDIPNKFPTLTLPDTGFLM